MSIEKKMECLKEDAREVVSDIKNDIEKEALQAIAKVTEEYEEALAYSKGWLRKLKWTIIPCAICLVVGFLIGIGV